MEETALRITKLRNLVTLTYRLKCKYEKTVNLRKNLILGPFGEILVVVERVRNSYLVCVCSLIYTAHKGPLPSYIFFCGLSGSTIFFIFIS